MGILGTEVVRKRQNYMHSHGPLVAQINGNVP